MNKKHKKLLLVIIWIIIIFIFSNMNSNTSNNGSKGIIRYITENIVDIFNIDDIDVDTTVKTLNYPIRKIMHITEYLILSLLILKYIDNTKHKYIITFIICLLFSLSDEYHQTFILGRTGQIKDIFYDMIGVFLYFIIYYFITKHKNKEQI